MPSLYMSYGPYVFDRPTILNYVQPNGIGNYALGYLDPQKGFVPKYVGRSDNDLRNELLARLPPTPTRTHFMFSYAGSTREAYEKECQNYHDFIQQLENDVHPAKPAGTNYRCPVCGQ